MRTFTPLLIGGSILFGLAVVVSMWGAVLGVTATLIPAMLLKQPRICDVGAFVGACIALTLFVSWVTSGFRRRR